MHLGQARVPSRRRGKSALMAIDMTPMIDMTFQLIAFFMFVLNFNNDIIDERVTLPLADNAAPTEDNARAPIFINMDRNGEVLLPGDVQVDPRFEPGIVARNLGQEAAVIRINMRAAGENPEGSEGLWTTIVIRADRLAPYGAVQRVIQIAQDEGFSKFWLRAEQATE